MIKLSENKTALLNLQSTIKALDSLNFLIEKYSEIKVGPAYCVFDYVSPEHSKIQFDREVMVEALNKQKQKIVHYLATLGIEAE